MSDIARENWSLQNATEYVQFQVAVTKTSFLTHQKNEKQLQESEKNVLDKLFLALKKAKSAFKRN